MSFYDKVYDVVKKIPEGKVATYGQIAILSGSPKASRAVGYALHFNPCPSVIPCYRVVNRFGYLAKKFAFGGIEVQKALLEKENIVVDDDFKVDLKKYLWDGNIYWYGDFMDTLNSQKINNLLHKKLNIEIRDVVTSTNTLLKDDSNEFSNCDVLIANHQTLGRGRCGKSFYSPEDTGIYFSLKIKSHFDYETIKLITPLCAVAMSEAIQSATNKKTQTKWINDIVVDDKKICGILCESILDKKTNSVNGIIVGVGINVYAPKNGFGDDLKLIAGHLTDTKTENLKNTIVAGFINNFFEYFNKIHETVYYEDYKKRCFILNKEIDVIKQDGIKSAIATDIDKSFGLIVTYKDGTQEILNSGEISIKINI